MKTLQTKQTTPRRFCRTSVVLAAVLASGILVCCTKSEEQTLASDSSLIALSAAVGTISGEVEAPNSAQALAQTKAPAVGTEALTLYFARADEIAGRTYGDYAATALSATRAAGTGAQPLTFAIAQKYLVSGLKTKLVGWYPGGATAAGDASGKGYYDGATRTVSWTIDGQQDVMTAPMQQGNAASALPAVTFEHRFTQLRFHPYAETQAAVDAWGKITRIDVLDQQNTVTYTLTNDASGGVSFSGTATNSFSSGIAAGGAALSLSTTANKVTDAKQMGNPVMIAPNSSSSPTLKLRIVTDKNKMKTVTVTFTQALTEGESYCLYMCFKELDITIEASVTQWSDATTSDKLGGVYVGDYYYTDGSFSSKVESGKTANGLIYYVDPANPSKFKVMALDEGSSLTWAAKNTYVIGSDAQSPTDGRGNVAAIKAAFDNRMAGVVITESTFGDAFPAAAYCYNYQGKNDSDPKGTWYLPAKNDLKYLYCAFNGAAPVIWKPDDSGAPVQDAAAQTKWNGLLTASDVSGTGVTVNHTLWSSTEYSSMNAWYIFFADGLVEYGNKSSETYVRCVRDITPPPAVGDYYYTDGSTSSKVESGKTANGLVYYVDAANPSKFKVMALDEGFSLAWAAKNTYVIGSDAWSPTDGRGNAAAIKAAFDNRMAGVAITESTFGDAFPAAAYCYNYQGKNSDPKGTWYLPAKNDLQYLYCAYNGAAPVIWASTASGAPTTNNAARTKWNGLLTASGVGGTGVTSGDFWSGSESSSYTSSAWYVYFSNGSTYASDKGVNPYVRCVREL